jgi:fluoride exporter
VRELTRYFMVGTGGFLGAAARYWLGGWIGDRAGTLFPWGTFAINLSGSFLIGLVMTVLTENAHWSPAWRYFIAIGFIGAYTTFSTFEYETLRSLAGGQIFLAVLNMTLSVALGFSAVWLGVVAGRALS